MNVLLFIILGIAAGYLSGLVGIGGGVIIIPALVYFFGMSQLNAQGTTIALMIPPIGIMAAIVYYKAGHVNVQTALFICLGFLIGSFFGANTAIGIPSVILKKYLVWYYCSFRCR